MRLFSNRLLRATNLNLRRIELIVERPLVSLRLFCVNWTYKNLFRLYELLRQQD